MLAWGSPHPRPHAQVPPEESGSGTCLALPTTLKIPEGALPSLLCVAVKPSTAPWVDEMSTGQAPRQCHRQGRSQIVRGALQQHS